MDFSCNLCENRKILAFKRCLFKANAFFCGRELSSELTSTASAAAFGHIGKRTCQSDIHLHAFAKAARSPPCTHPFLAQAPTLRLNHGHTSMAAALALIGCDRRFHYLNAFHLSKICFILAFGIWKQPAQSGLHLFNCYRAERSLVSKKRPGVNGPRLRERGNITFLRML